MNGSGFGATRGTSSGQIGNRKCTTYLLWSARKIEYRVPAKAKHGELHVRVTTAAGIGNAKIFEVKRSLSPAGGGSVAACGRQSGGCRRATCRR